MIKFRARHKSGFWVDSPLTAFTFPAGEAHIKVSDGFEPNDYTHHLADLRGHDPQDLMHLLSWADFLDREDDAATRSIFLPYLPAARADRGAPLGAAIYSHLINAAALDHVITIDPHSPVAPGLYRGLKTFPVERIIRKEVQDPTHDRGPDIYTGVIAPDKGAEKRALAAAHAIGVPLYRAGKSRDEASGKLSGFHMIDELPRDGKLLIVDDICDGGGTFLGLAEATGLNKDRLDLWVTHGIFSKGLGELRQHFGVIHTTDSFYGLENDYGIYQTGTFTVNGKTFAHDPDLVKIHKLDPYLYGEI